MQQLQQPLVQCLDLSRPESISTAGWCDDSVVQALRYPQPMLYSAAKGGLVTYETPGRTPIEETKWLNRLSSPKRTRSKSQKAEQSSESPCWQQRHQQGQQQQGSCFTDQAQHNLSHTQAQQGAHQEQQQQQATKQPSNRHAAALALRVAAAAAVAGRKDVTQDGIHAVSQAERQLLTAPQVFSWGGRIRTKHHSLCSMHEECGRAHCNSSREDNADGALGATAATAVAGSGAVATAAVCTGCGGSSEGGTALSSVAPVLSCVQRSPGTRQALDSETAAAAEALGANADRLLRLLKDRKKKQMQQKQKQKGGKVQQLQPQQQNNSYARNQLAGIAQQRAADNDAVLQDDPIGMTTSDFLRL